MFITRTKRFSLLLQVGVGMMWLHAVQCTGPRPDNLGLTEGKLRPCPSSPNCVSSQSADSSHFVRSLPFHGNLDESRESLVKMLHDMAYVHVVIIKPNYVYAEFTTGTLRFVDDVEFLLDASDQSIHVRSASRMGYWDMGANRKRVEDLRNRWSSLQ